MKVRARPHDHDGSECGRRAQVYAFEDTVAAAEEYIKVLPEQIAGAGPAQYSTYPSWWAATVAG
jgi:hypothetical protein